MCPNWLYSEDIQVCILWARQSLDPITSQYSNKNNLWEQIHEDYVKIGVALLRIQTNVAFLRILMPKLV